MIYGTPTIVTNGLVLNLDAANTKSYVSGSTNWFSLGNPSLSGSLVNGPTFSSRNGGSIVFDGSNDYVNLGNNSITQFPSASAWSFSFISELLSQNTAYPSIFSKGNSATNGILIFFSDSGSIYFKHNNSQPSYVRVPMNTPFQYTVTYAGTGSVKVYLNGIYRNDSSTIVSTNTSSDAIIGGGDSFSNIRMYNVSKYNKELSAQEVLQNYNALKSRFGLT
jgi:hypothetical protein